MVIKTKGRILVLAVVLVPSEPKHQKPQVGQVVTLTGMLAEKPQKPGLLYS